MNNSAKLILDQPDTVTTTGKIEHVVVEQLPAKKLENNLTNSEDVLINEAPLDGLEIIMG